MYSKATSSLRHKVVCSDCVRVAINRGHKKVEESFLSNESKRKTLKALIRENARVKSILTHPTIANQQ